MTVETKTLPRKNSQGFFDIYIAHARDPFDNAMGQQLYDLLYAKGYSVAFDLGHALHGQFTVAARQIIARSKCVVLVLTKTVVERLDNKSLQASHLRLELKTAKLMGVPIVIVRQPFAVVGEGNGPTTLWDGDNTKYDDSDDGRDPWNWKQILGQTNQVYGQTYEEIVEILLNREIPSIEPETKRAEREREQRECVKQECDAKYLELKTRTHRLLVFVALCVLVFGGIVGWWLGRIRMEEASPRKIESAVSSPVSSNTPPEPGGNLEVIRPVKDEKRGVWVVTDPVTSISNRVVNPTNEVPIVSRLPLPAPMRYKAETLSTTSGAKIMRDRDNASGSKTLKLVGGQSLECPIKITHQGHYEVVVRYSKDTSAGPRNGIRVLVDGKVAAFQALATGDYGKGWNTFATATNSIGDLGAGDKAITLTVDQEDQIGVEIDFIQLQVVGARAER